MSDALRKAIAKAVAIETDEERWTTFDVADAVLALPELAALIADADNWRRATTGDPTEPLPLAMQARELLLRVRELEAAVARVQELAEAWETVPAAEEWDHGYHAGYDESTRNGGEALRRALDGDQ